MWSSTKRALRLVRYLVSGRLPWSVGYAEYKELVLLRHLRDADLLDRFLCKRELPRGYGRRLDERVVEYPWLFSRLRGTDALPPGERWLLDAGSALNHAFLLKHRVLAQRSVVSCTLAPEDTVCHAKVSYVWGDLRYTVFRDNSFDEIACISTLEHVGMDNSLLYIRKPWKGASGPEDRQKAVRRFRAALKPGGRLYVTVPFGRSEDHGWLQQFDRERVAATVGVFDGSSAQITYYRYDREGWQLADAKACADCRYFDIHHAREFDEDHAAAARAVACLELVK